MDFRKIIIEYKGMLEKGENLALIDKFYAEDIIQIENQSLPLKGKQVLLQMERNNLEGVFAFSQQIISFISDEISQIVMGEMLIKFHSKRDGWRVLEEAFVQHWKEGKIKFQRFYYSR